MKLFITSIFIICNFLPFLLASNDSILVLLDHLSIKETHSIFFKSLQDRGFDLTFRIADDATLSLNKYGTPLYKHLILFSPSAEEFGGNINTQVLTEFIDNGGNILVAINENIGDAIRELAIECGLEIDDEGSQIIDHFNYYNIDNDNNNNNNDNNDKHTTIIVNTDDIIDAPTIIGDKKQLSPILFRGIGMHYDPKNLLVLNILKGSSTCYSHNPSKPINEYPFVVGKNTVLISALQARNNARIIFVGSLDFFSDKFFQLLIDNNNDGIAEKTGNEQLALSLSKWVFKEKGVLRVNNVKHFKKQPKGSMIMENSSYTIMDDVEYWINIELYDDEKKLWQPFLADDIQLEFVRIDPFIRKTLTMNNGQYVAEFRIPDVYGVYKFIIDYKRIGYTNLYSSTQISVRPLQHTQYERFIISAYPYYFSSFSMMFGVFIFSFIFLYFNDNYNKQQQQQQQMKTKSE